MIRCASPPTSIRFSMRLSLPESCGRPGPPGHLEVSDLATDGVARRRMTPYRCHGSGPAAERHGQRYAVFCRKPEVFHDFRAVFYGIGSSAPYVGICLRDRWRLVPGLADTSESVSAWFVNGGSPCLFVCRL